LNEEFNAGLNTYNNHRTNPIIDHPDKSITPAKIKNEVKARAYLGTDQLNVSSDTWFKVLLDTKNYDIGNDFDIVNHKFVVPTTGYYLIIGQVYFKTSSVIANKRYGCCIHKGADDISMNFNHSSTTQGIGINTVTISYLSINDEITLYAYQSSGVNTVDVNMGSHLNFLAIHLLSI
jgi:hypothetical protein